jgi:hypothetical protein
VTGGSARAFNTMSAFDWLADRRSRLIRDMNVYAKNIRRPRAPGNSRKTTFVQK